MTSEEEIATLIRAHLEGGSDGSAEARVATAAAAIAALLAWQPIDTAPRDGKHFLGLAVGPDTNFAVEAWREGDRFITALEAIVPNQAFVLTHWMPLVTAPAAGSELQVSEAPVNDSWSLALEPFKDKISAGVEKVVTSNRELFRDYVGPKALALLRDDEVVTNVAEKIYPALPFAVRMLLKEDAFTAFLLKHRASLISVLQRA